MSVRLVTLNIEGDRHLSRVLPFLKEQNFDVICLQEVFSTDVKKIEEELDLNGYYFPLNFVKEKNGTNKVLEGLLVLTDREVKHLSWHYYAHTKNLDKKIPAVFLTIEQEEKEYNIISTHFTWTPDGKESPEQVESWNNLLPELQKVDNFVFCGDFNVPRNDSMYEKMTEYLIDNLPKDISTTLDSKYHRIPNLERDVDNIYSHGNHKVTKVEVHDGLSDHMAITSTIELIE